MKPTIRLTILTAIALFCALVGAPNARAAGNIFENIAIPGDPGRFFPEIRTSA
jgi:hypothetical protein